MVMGFVFVLQKRILTLYIALSVPFRIEKGP